MSEFDKIEWPGWETVRLIGRGSFGAVYEIRRELYGNVERAALKHIRIPQSSSDIKEMVMDGYDDESITATFQNHLKNIVAEYSLMRKLNGSTNVVNCDDVRIVEDEDAIGWDIYIKMELLTPLGDALPAKIPPEMTERLAKDLCRALVLCQKHEIVHRDIKPQNIFVSENGDFKLGDFGIAKTVEKTSGGTKIGTYKYMAPEVYNNRPYGAAADQYSLGLVLYWMLNERRMPFLPLPPQKLTSGMDERARDRRLRGETIPAPAHGSEALKAIVLKACAYDPEDRFASAAEMLAALEQMTDAPVAAAPHAEEIKLGASAAVPASAGRPAQRIEETGESEETVGVFDRRGKARTSAPERAPVDPVPKAQKAAPADEPAEDGTVSVFKKTAQPVETPAENGTVGAFRRPASPAGQPSAAPDKDAESDAKAPAIRETEQAAAPAEPQATEQKKKKKPFWLLIPAAALIALAVLFATGTLGGGKTPQPQQGQEQQTTRLSISAQPQSRSCAEGETAEFTVNADGEGLTYQWEYMAPNSTKWNKSGLDGCDTATLRIEATEARDGQQYRCVVTDKDGNKLTTDAVTLSVLAGETGAKQLDWTEWSEALPSGITDKEYDIEQRTLYSSRTLETTSSTSKTMSGWELYDTKDGDGGWGQWSDWSQTAVSSSSTRDVETQKRYRYSDKETTTSTSGSLSGWMLENTTYSWGSYGAWSDWSTTSVSSSDARQVETKTQYQYRDKEYKYGVTDSSLSGWTQINSYVEYGAWSGNQTTTSKPTESNTLRIVDQYASGYNYFHYCCNYYDGTWCVDSIPYGNTANTHYHTLYTTSKLPAVNIGDMGNQQAYGGSGSGASPCSSNFYIWFLGSTVYTYVYQTRTATTLYDYERWGEWSGWSDTACSQSSTREVQTRTLYRYRDRQQTTTYHYYRWKAWSSWSTTSASQSDTRKVETTTFYRYRDKLTEKTYYFRRWTDWSEYSNGAVEPSDTVQVQTRTQYRYKSKTE